MVLPRLRRGPWEGGTLGSSLLSVLWHMGKAYPLSRPSLPVGCRGKDCQHVLLPNPPPFIAKALPVGLS